MAPLVVSTATLKCKHGSDNAPLISTGLAQFEVLSLAVAGIINHTPGSNIFPFGTCNKLGGPCVPVTPSPWHSPGSLEIAGVDALHADAKLDCTTGGSSVITVLDPKQHIVSLDELYGMREAFLSNLKELFDSLDFSQELELLQNLAQAGAKGAIDPLLAHRLTGLEKELAREGLSASDRFGLMNTISELKTLKGLLKLHGDLLMAKDILDIVHDIISGRLREAAKKIDVVASAAAAMRGCAVAAAETGLGAIAAAAVCGVVGAGTAEIVNQLHSDKDPLNPLNNS